MSAPAPFWKDLAQQEPSTSVSADVCIIGSGPAGLTLARGLSEQGLRVVLLERGGVDASALDPGEGVAFDGSEYRGATLGRAFALGGTSNLWGGQLLPVLPSDIAERPHASAPEWPIAHEDLLPHFSRLESWLGVSRRSFDMRLCDETPHPICALDWGPFAPRFSKWIPFGRRNLATAWSGVLARSGLVTGWLHARVLRYRSVGGKDGRTLTEVVACSPAGRELAVSARYFVVAAGTIESATSLLQMRRQGALAREEGRDVLGRFLHDHISIRVARVRVLKRRRFMELFAPFFDKATMRTLRIELGTLAAAGLKLPALYGHFVSTASLNSGFAVARDGLRALQRRDVRAALNAATRIPAALPGLAAMAYWRYARKRLLFPADGELFLHVDVEQPPQWRNRVGLPDRASDESAARIDWQLGIDAGEIAGSVQSLLSEFWKKNCLGEIASLEFLESNAINDSGATNLYDIYHGAGTTRMASLHHDGCVDAHLRALGSDNVYVASSSTFPSMGAANPTFTLMALALRLAAHLSQRSRETI